MQFNNKVIIITGASNGIGAAAALLFAKDGAHIYNLDIAKPLYSNNHIHWLECDVSCSKNIQRAITTIIARESRIDYLFANAGVYAEIPLQDMGDEAINNIVDVNFKGILFTLRAVLPHMRAQKHGSIVLMGSEQSFLGRANNSVYGATKGAVAQLTKALALECAADNIRVNAVCPGAIMTKLTEQALMVEAKRKQVSCEAIYSAILATIPLGRFGTPEDVAQAVAFLFSDAAAFITGSLLSLDGGVVAGSCSNNQYQK